MKEDIAKDSRLFEQRKKEVDSINKLFFDRFAGNQDDWTEDHRFIFRYTDYLDVEKGECDASELAKTIRVLKEAGNPQD